MADAKHCPECSRDIGVWPVFTAGMPNRIWCPHCSARLSYSGIAGVVFILLVLLAGAVAVAYYAATIIPGLSIETQLVVFVGILLVLWVLVELAVVRFLRGNREMLTV